MAGSTPSLDDAARETGDPATARANGSLTADDAAWDDFVATSAMPSYLQTTAWAAIKRTNGWSSLRVIADGRAGPIGAQILVQRPRGLPWGLGYVPRGPISSVPLEATALRTFTERLREVARMRRVAAVRMEPEALKGRGLEESLIAQGWRNVPSIQQDITRIIEIDRPEEAIWNDFHRKCRQSINKSERYGVRVVDGDASRLGDFYRIHVESMVRVGIVARAPGTFREMWDQLSPRGMAHLLFAEAGSTGEAVGTLFLVSCGRRVVDLYGGTTLEGARTRANYLLKWEAIKRSQAWGYREYDLWGLPRKGIAQFKAGFGGREEHYIGGWELPVSRLGAAVLAGGTLARARYRRLRGVDELRAPEVDA